MGPEFIELHDKENKLILIKKECIASVSHFHDKVVIRYTNGDPLYVEVIENYETVKKMLSSKGKQTWSA